MKPIKMLGLASLAALLAMAFVGASSAMAEPTALCKVDAEECPAGELYSHVHEATASKAAGLLLSSVVTIECEALFLGDVTSANNLGNPLEIEGHFTYAASGTNCETTTGAGCTVTETSTHAVIKVLKLGHELADITGEGEVNAHCGALINCTYDGTGLTGHGLGPLLSSALNGEARLEEQALNKTGGLFCPKTERLDLLTSPLEKVYIAH